MEQREEIFQTTIFLCGYFYFLAGRLVREEKRGGAGAGELFPCIFFALYNLFACFTFSICIGFTLILAHLLKINDLNLLHQHN